MREAKGFLTFHIFHEEKRRAEREGRELRRVRFFPGERAFNAQKSRSIHLHLLLVRLHRNWGVRPSFIELYGCIYCSGNRGTAFINAAQKSRYGCIKSLHSFRGTDIIYLALFSRRYGWVLMLYGLQILGTDFFKCTAGIFAEVQCSYFEIKSVVKISDISL